MESGLGKVFFFFETRFREVVETAKPGLKIWSLYAPCDAQMLIAMCKY